jgi:hypothetical protein
MSGGRLFKSLGLAVWLVAAAARAGDPAPPASTQSLSPRVIASQGDPDLTLPRLLPGLWEYRRTQVGSEGSKPQTSTIRKCSDPSAEFAMKRQQLKQRGCVFSPMRQTGRQFEAKWRCTAPDGAVLAMRDVITVISDSSYQNESDAFVSHEATHSSIVAIRQGDCPATAPASRPAQPH